MRSLIITLLALTVFTLPSVSSAAMGRPGPYVSGFLGTSFARDTNISGNDPSTPSRSPFDDRASFDPGIYVGGTGGYDFGIIRLEGELSYRNAKFDTIRESSGVALRRVEGDLGVFATMFNVYFDLHNSTPVTPYLGGGIGFASLHLGETTDSLGIVYDASNDTVFASQVGAGMDVAINSRSSIDIGYRYFVTDKAKFNGEVTSSDLRFESHNVLVGFKFKF
jgi:opacity protein-like surface antigen